MAVSIITYVYAENTTNWGLRKSLNPFSRGLVDTVGSPATSSRSSHGREDGGAYAAPANGVNAARVAKRTWRRMARDGCALT